MSNYLRKYPKISLHLLVLKFQTFLSWLSCNLKWVLYIRCWPPHWHLHIGHPKAELELEDHHFELPSIPCHSEMCPVLSDIALERSLFRVNSWLWHTKPSLWRFWWHTYITELYLNEEAKKNFKFANNSTRNTFFYWMLRIIVFTFNESFLLGFKCDIWKKYQ